MKFKLLSLLVTQTAGGGAHQIVIEFDTREEADLAYQVILPTTLVPRNREKGEIAVCGGWGYQTIRRLYQ